MRQAMNPYLPLYEYIPDGEPHVFGDRIYVYGSHDRFDGKKFCLNDYVCYSAAVNNLKEWRYEGVIYKKTQDPRMRDGNHELWAPDVVRGKDGRYYLYYCPDDKIRSIGVAVCGRDSMRFTAWCRTPPAALSESGRGIRSSLIRVSSSMTTDPSICIPETDPECREISGKSRRLL